MASGSESSDEFYDAMDDSLVAKTLDETTISSSSSKRRPGRSHDTELNAAFSTLSLEQPNRSHHGQPADESGAHVSSKEPSKSPKLGAAAGFAASVAEHVFKEPKSLRSQRFHEFRQAMQNDDDENPGNILTPDSQNSSVEGVYVAPRSNYPFRVIESDVTSIHSICSLGIVGRIMAGGSIDASGHSVGKDSTAVKQVQPQAISKQQQSLLQQQQPASKKGAQGGEVVAGTSRVKLDSSTKEPTVSTKTNEMLSAVISTVTMPLAESRPVAPPRRKKKMRKLSSSSSDQCTANEPGGGGGAGTSDQQPTDSSSSEVLMVKSAQSQPMIAKLSTDDLASRGEAMASGTNGGSIVSSGSDGTTTTGGADSYSGKTLPSPATLESITREIENSFEEAASAVAGSVGGSGAMLINGGTGSLTRLASTPAAVTSVGGGGAGGNTGLSRCTTTQLSPTGSMKSVSAMARASWTDNSQGLISRVTKGQYVVKPTDGVFNKAEGPSGDEIARIDRIHKEFLSNISNSGSIGGTGAAGGGGGAGPGRGSLGSHRKNYSITGTNSLEGGMRTSLMAKQLHVKERRKSAGDEDMLKQLNMYVRTRTSSGKQLTDMEILEQVPVKNLDTGENFPLSAVEEKLPQCINPLSLHIMRLTSHIPETDEESVGPGQPGDSDSVQPGYEEELEAEGLEGGRLKRRTAAKLKRFFRTTAKKTVSKAKSIASEVSHARHKEDVADIQDVSNPEQNIKIKASSTNKGPYDFAKLQHVQDLTGVHTVAVWCMKFSSCGRLLATAGQDRVLCIWVLKDAYPFFQALRTKYNAADQKSSPTPSEESLNSTLNAAHAAEDGAALPEPPDDVSPGPFMPHSFCTYSGHTSDLLDVSWSKNYFILSSSMDKTVRLWHISRRECLCCFQHIDFVTAIAFHPRDDRYFLSGSLDGKLRLWNIPEKKVALWNEVDGQTKLITAANFCANGKFAVVGSYDGRCIFYNTDQLKYHTQIHVRSTRGRNAIGRKISGIEPMPGEDKILVTSNDSRIRLYDLRDLNLSCKYKGYFNSSSQIKASFSHDGKYIISGSENQCIYIWKTHHEYTKLSSVRRDRSDFWEGIKAHNATVTCAIFAPHPEAIIKPDPDESTSADNISVNQSFAEQSKKACRGYVMVSADFNGCIKVFINKTKPKHSSLPYTAIAD